MTDLHRVGTRPVRACENNSAKAVDLRGRDVQKRSQKIGVYIVDKIMAFFLLTVIVMVVIAVAFGKRRT
jgi:hypothetical protein